MFELICIEVILDFVLIDQGISDHGNLWMHTRLNVQECTMLNSLTGTFQRYPS